MMWLRKSAVFVTLVLGVAAVLYLTGKMDFHWNEKGQPRSAGGHEGEVAGNHEEQSHIVGGNVVLEADVVSAAGILTVAVAPGSVASKNCSTKGGGRFLCYSPAPDRVR
jgi:hypothetical protein